MLTDTINPNLNIVDNIEEENKKELNDS